MPSTDREELKEMIATTDFRPAISEKFPTNLRRLGMEYLAEALVEPLTELITQKQKEAHQKATIDGWRRLISVLHIVKTAPLDEMKDKAEHWEKLSEKELQDDLALQSPDREEDNT